MIILPTRKNLVKEKPEVVAKIVEHLPNDINLFQLASLAQIMSDDYFAEFYFDLYHYEGKEFKFISQDEHNLITDKSFRIKEAKKNKFKFHLSSYLKPEKEIKRSFEKQVIKPNKKADAYFLKIVGQGNSLNRIIFKKKIATISYLYFLQLTMVFEFLLAVIKESLKDIDCLFITHPFSYFALNEESRPYSLATPFFSFNYSNSWSQLDLGFCILQVDTDSDWIKEANYIYRGV